MIEIGRIVTIHPGAHAVDVVLLRTGQRAAGVPLMTSGASTNHRRFRPAAHHRTGRRRMVRRARARTERRACGAGTFGGGKLGGARQPVPAGQRGVVR